MPDVVSNESAENSLAIYREGHSKIIAGVMDLIVRIKSYAICKLKNEFAVLTSHRIFHLPTAMKLKTEKKTPLRHNIGKGYCHEIQDELILA